MDDCEFCAGRTHGHRGGDLDDNPYIRVGQYEDMGPYWLWRLGFTIGQRERSMDHGEEEA